MTTVTRARFLALLGAGALGACATLNDPFPHAGVDFGAHAVMSIQ
jgi:hypothetical protein